MLPAIGMLADAVRQIGEMGESLPSAALFGSGEAAEALDHRGALGVDGAVDLDRADQPGAVVVEDAQHRRGGLQVGDDLRGEVEAAGGGGALTVDALHPVVAASAWPKAHRPRAGVDRDVAGDQHVMAGLRPGSRGVEGPYGGGEGGRQGQGEREPNVRRIGLRRR